MSGIDRKQIIRRDCTTCGGNGFVAQNGSESSCDTCGGSGLLEKEIAYRFDKMGQLSRNDIAQEFGVKPDELKDSGHDAGDQEDKTQ